GAISSHIASGGYDLVVATRDYHIDPGAHFSETPDYKLPERPDRDFEWTQDVQEVWQAYRELPAGPETRKIRWMIEELRLSLFAQTIKTAYPVSDKRIYKAIDQVMAR
ncbi:DUF3418 domain-containing protein, partial [Kibdelosporangium lantanae]